MAVVREDAWTSSHDELLKRIVLKHIASGSTQLKAFQEAANTLKRTESACGYRWNAQVRQLHKEEVASAKEERYKLRQRPQPELEVVKEESIKQTPEVNEDITSLQKEVDELKTYIKYLQGTQIKQLNEKILDLESQLKIKKNLANKYQSLFHRSVQLSTIYAEVKAFEEE